MAPPRKPTAQKQLEGTDRPDRANPKEPSYRAAPPPMPDWLSPGAAEEWPRVVAQLMSQRVVAEGDQAAVASFCELVAEFADITRSMAAGEKFGDEAKKKYPLSKLRLEVLAQLRAAWGELGLSPASRSKVSSIGDGKEADPMAPPDRAPRPARKAPQVSVH